MYGDGNTTHTFSGCLGSSFFLFFLFFICVPPAFTAARSSYNVCVCVCVCVFLCVWMCTCMYACICVYGRKHANTHLCKLTCFLLLKKRVCEHVSARACVMYVCLNSRLHERVSVWCFACVCARVDMDALGLPV